MKRSHYQTPRSLADCQFMPSADPIEHYRHTSRFSEWAVWIALGAGAVVAIIVVVFA